MMGGNFLSLTNFSSEHPNHHDLLIFGKSYKKIMGNIVIEMAYKPYAVDLIPTQIEFKPAKQKDLVREGGMLVVIIHEARSLQGKNYINPRVLAIFGGKSRKTQTMMNNRDPIWEEVFTFMLQQPPTNETLHMKVINTPRMRLIRRKEFIALIDISLVDVVNNKRIIHTYSFQKGMSQLDVELQWRTYDQLIN
ncbi:synaptotagmin-1-like [Rutidosis leptorrhynchoides]|uniref:synaptotagmin-1-like n=1 Tax=Rutidosis leptorrhynchoides TaxID=125765 RepID=UPI003A99E471